MRHLIFVIFATVCLAGVATAAEKAQPHKALAQPVPRAGCLDRTRLSAEPTAYTPAAAMMPPRCGRLLSTDTLISNMHRWDQT